MPPNLFFGTSIATCIIVLKKSKTDNKILFIDASEQFVHEGNKNKLSAENIDAILDAFRKRRTKAHFCKLVPFNQIQENDYNITVSAYVEQKDDKEEIDIEKLNEQIAQIVARQTKLRREIDKIVEELG